MTLKRGQRHSRDDQQRIRSARDAARAIDALMAELGDDDWQDDAPTALILSHHGGRIKALGETADGGLRIGGYLVSYGNPDQTDLSGEFFTKDTDFGFEETVTSAVYFNHRLPLKTRDGGFVVVKEKIGEGTLTKDEQGVLIEAVLYNRAQYEQMLAALGWSSGTASHLVEFEPVGKAVWIKAWPLGLDASITPTPNEPRNQATMLPSRRPEAGAQEAGDASRMAADRPTFHILRRSTRDG